MALDKVTNAVLADNSVNSPQYVDGSVDAVHVASDVVSTTGTQTLTNKTLTNPSISNIVGMIASFGSAAAPTGWIICNGAAVSRTTTYDALFAVIGTTWGAGNGSSTFNLPDLRGAFLRGTGSHGTANMADGSSDFAGPALGAFENDQFQSHGHNIQTAQTGLLVEYAGGAGSAGYTNTGNYTTANTAGHVWRAATPTNAGYPGAGVPAPRHGDETRPFNLGVTFCIKY